MNDHKFGYFLGEDVILSIVESIVEVIEIVGEVDEGLKYMF